MPTLADELMIRAVTDYLLCWGYPPTVADLCHDLQLADVVVRRRLDRLEYRHKWILRDADISRGLAVTIHGWHGAGYTEPPPFPALDPDQPASVPVNLRAPKQRDERDQLRLF